MAVIISGSVDNAAMSYKFVNLTHIYVPSSQIVVDC